jgi:putative transposase
LARDLQQFHGFSERRACQAVGLTRSVYRYRPRPDRDQEVIDELLALAHHKPEYGFGKLFETLRRRGRGWNHKRVYRL